ncbi:MAG: hypothetical protein JXA42_26125 [Anaerolineales bacterium]|nr:hypothetical protein [Anaerolineales bacterium]
MNQLDVRLKAHHDNIDAIDHLVVEIKIDRELMVDFDYYATDYGQLLKSIDQDGEFYILTCWCGFPGCAGIKRGIEVRHEGDVVYWRVLNPRPERRFVFRREAYQQAIRCAIEQGNRLIAYLVSSYSRPLSLVPGQNSQFSIPPD